MSIIKGSRYENLPITTIVKNGISKPFINIREKLNINDTNNIFFVHTIKEDQELDFISFADGNSSLKWWIIAEINNIFFPLEDLVSQNILLPNNLFMSNPKKKVS